MTSLDMLGKIAVAFGEHNELVGFKELNNGNIVLELKDTGDVRFVNNFSDCIEYSDGDDTRRYYKVIIGIDGFIDGIAGIINIHSFKSFEEANIDERNIGFLLELIKRSM